MKITKIKSIDGRTYKNFHWTARSENSQKKSENELADFTKYNVIYGWNGTGKTTLSEIFQMIEKREFDPSKGINSFCIEFSNKPENPIDICHNQLNQPNKIPSIRVFNKTFVEKNVFSEKGANLIFLGEGDIQKHQELLQKEESLKNLTFKKKEIDEEKKRNSNEFNKFLTDKASEIRENLSITNQKNYNRNECENDFKQFSSTTNIKQYLKDERQLEDLKHTIYNLNYKEIPLISIEEINLKQISEQLKTLLEANIVSRTINKLINNPSLSNWVKEGIQIHQNHQSTNCEFCEQVLPINRINDLNKHFNDQFKNFEEEIIQYIGHIGTKLKLLEEFKIPERDKFYRTLSGEYDGVRSTFCKQLLACIEFLKEAKRILESKKANPFSAVDFSTKCPEFNTFSFKNLNSLVEEHNNRFNNHIQTQNKARDALKLHYIAKNFNDYKNKKEDKEKSEISSSTLSNEINILTQEIGQLNAEILNHKKAVEELNSDLKNYLKHEELKFIDEAQEHGYKIMRGHQIARSLSEGEKTAIALLYFLKTLKDRDFKLEDGIVVIDDPVSSLDEHALFNAFGYIKDRTKDAKQLFLLTHNKIFFSQVKYWLNYNKYRKYSNFYQTNCHIADGSRISKIIELNKLLKDYDSEYHYLFQTLFEYNSKRSFVEEGNNTYTLIYALPNIARRLLEVFFSFKFPNINALEDIATVSNFPSEKLDTIVRFVQAHSHKKTVDFTYHNTSISNEISEIISDVLEWMKFEDSDHYKRMVETINKKT